MNNFAYILERLSTRAKNALIAAQLVSEQLHHDHIGTEHLLYGIISEKSSFAAEVLLKSKVNADAIRDELDRLNQNHVTTTWKPILSDNLKVALDRAAAVAQKYGYQFIGTEHFLYGIVDLQQSRAKVILSKLNVDIRAMHESLAAVFENLSRFPDMGDVGDGVAARSANAVPPAAGMPNMGNPMANRNHAGNGSALEYFTQDITARAAAGKIDPVIGRRKEIDRMVNILNRRIDVRDSGADRQGNAETRAHRMCSAASGTSATLARRDNCSARM